MKLFFSLFFVLWSLRSWSHSGEDHVKPVISQTLTARERLVVDNRRNSTLVEINKKYISSVKSIFERSCFDCHGNTTNYPWYYNIPGVKQVIDSDIEKAKKHLDFSHDFPFRGHDTPINDLSSISKSIENSTMPPFGYSLMHRNAKLSGSEIILIQNWIKKSIDKLNQQ